MQPAVLVVWAIGLAGAVAPAIMILTLCRIVIGILRDLLSLSRAIGDAAQGIDRHTAVVPALPDLRAAAWQLADAASASRSSWHWVDEPPERAR